MGLEEDFKSFSERVRLLKTLTKGLPPQALRCATKSDRITQVFDTIKIPESNDERWEVFNKRMDALFGEDVRDSKTGRLLNLLRGEHGIDLVLMYLETEIKAGVLPWGHICSDLRSSLKAETISEALLSKVWIRSGLLDVNAPRKPLKKGST